MTDTPEEHVQPLSGEYFTGTDFQDLSSFRNPPGARGRSAIFVQLWWIVQALLVNTSPQIMYGWRLWWLRLFGAKIGKNVLIRPSVRVTYPWKVTIGDNVWIGDNAELYTLDEIRIGNDCVVSQRSYLCTGSHDARATSFDLITKPIILEDQSWVASECFVMPGVTIGRGAVVAARSLVTRSVNPGTVVAGSPAKFVGRRVPR